MKIFPKIPREELETFYNKEFMRCNNKLLKALTESISIEKEAILDNLIDKPSIGWNNIMEVNYLEGKITIDAINNTYNFLNVKSDIITKFHYCYDIINSSSYIKIMLNKEYYMMLPQMQTEIFSNNKINSTHTMRGAIENNQELSKLVVLYESLYTIYLEKTRIIKNCSVLKFTPGRDKITINFIVPSEHQYHYIVLMENLVEITRNIPICRGYKINIYGSNQNINGSNQNSHYSDFKNFIKMHHNSNITTSFITIPEKESSIEMINNSSEIYSENINYIFSSNIQLSNKTCDKTYDKINQCLYKFKDNHLAKKMNFIELYK